MTTLHRSKNSTLRSTFGVLFLLCLFCLCGTLCAQLTPPFANDPLAVIRGCPFCGVGLVVWYKVLPHYRAGLIWPSLLGTNHAAISPAAAGWTSTKRPGGYGEMGFDGASSYVHSGQNAGITYNAPFTICVWYHSESTTGIASLVTTSTINTYTGLTLNAGQNNAYPDFTLGNQTGSAYLQIGSTGSLATSVWHHLCGVYDGSQVIGGLSMYAEGVPLSTYVVTNTGSGAFNDNPLSVGAETNNVSHLLGGMDDVMLWRRALSAQEILAVYRSTSTVEPFEGDQLAVAGLPTPPSTSPRRRVTIE